MPPPLFDKELVAHFRLKALKRFGDQGQDFLLRHVNDDLIDRLGLVKREFKVCLNLGCHNGELNPRLGALEGVQQVVATETALPLLTGVSSPCVVADAEMFPFRDSSFDLIVSALNLQWVNDLPRALLRLRQGLKPDGLFLGATLGTGSLGELRHALMQAEEEVLGGISPRVAPFVDVRDMGQLLQGAGFTLPVTDRDVLKVRYGSAMDLMQDLRKMGASNALTQRRRQPVSRRFFERVNEIYAARFSDPDGRVTATFEIIFLLGWAPHPDQPKPLRPGSAQISLTEVLKKG